MRLFRVLAAGTLVAVLLATPVQAGVPVVADLAVTKVSLNGTEAPGADVSYSIHVQNLGPATASSVTLTDDLPTSGLPNTTTFVSFTSPLGWNVTVPTVGSPGTVTATIGSMNSGASADFTLVIHFNAAIPGGTIITNDACVSSLTFDPIQTNNCASRAIQVLSGSATGDLSTAKSDSPDPVAPGSNLTYTITVTNNGPSAATTVALSDPIPGGTGFQSLTAPGGWTLTAPAVGVNGTVTATIPTMPMGSAVFTLVVQVNAGLSGGTTLTNVACVSSDLDPGASNDCGTTITTVAAAAASVPDAAMPSPPSSDTPFAVLGFGALLVSVLATAALMNRRRYRSN